MLGRVKKKLNNLELSGMKTFLFLSHQASESSMNFKYPKRSLAWVDSVVVLSNVKTLKNRKVFHVLLYSFLCSFCELKKTNNVIAVSDNTRPACVVKNVSRFGIFFKVNHTVTIPILACQIKAAITNRSCKIKG